MMRYFPQIIADARAHSGEPRISACVPNIRSSVRKQDVDPACVNVTEWRFLLTISLQKHANLKYIAIFQRQECPLCIPLHVYIKFISDLQFVSEYAE